MDPREKGKGTWEIARDHGRGERVKKETGGNTRGELANSMAREWRRATAGQLPPGTGTVAPPFPNTHAARTLLSLLPPPGLPGTAGSTSPLDIFRCFSPPAPFLPSSPTPVAPFRPSKSLHTVHFSSNDAHSFGGTQGYIPDCR